MWPRKKEKKKGKECVCVCVEVNKFNWICLGEAYTPVGIQDYDKQSLSNNFHSMVAHAFQAQNTVGCSYR